MWDLASVLLCHEKASDGNIAVSDFKILIFLGDSKYPNVKNGEGYIIAASGNTANTIQFNVGLVYKIFIEFIFGELQAVHMTTLVRDC